MRYEQSYVNDLPNNSIHKEQKKERNQSHLDSQNSAVDPMCCSLYFLSCNHPILSIMQNVQVVSPLILTMRVAHSAIPHARHLRLRRRLPCHRDNAAAPARPQRLPQWFLHRAIFHLLPKGPTFSITNFVVKNPNTHPKYQFSLNVKNPNKMFGLEYRNDAQVLLLF